MHPKGDITTSKLNQNMSASPVRSSQLHLYSLKSQSHCLSGIYNLYNQWHPLSLDSWVELGKTCHIDGEKGAF